MARSEIRGQKTEDDRAGRKNPWTCLRAVGAGGTPSLRHQEHWSKAEQELGLTPLNSNESEGNAALAFDRNQTGPAVRDALDGREGSDFHKAETAKVRSRGEPPQVGSKAPRRQTKKVARGRQA
jgi:hypothetical protein